MPSWKLFTLASLALSLSLPGQTLTNGLAVTGGQKGCVFDLVNTGTSTLTISSFDQNFFGASPGLPTVAVYVKTSASTYAGSETSPQDWTLIGQAFGLAAQPQGTLTPLPIPVGVAIPAGGRRAFYITCTLATPTLLAWANTGAPAGTVVASNAQLALEMGLGVAYSFGPVFGPRAWLGTIHYSVSGPSALYETNDPAAAFQIDNVLGTSFTPAVSTKCAGSSGNLFASTNVPLTLWEGFLGIGALVPAGGGALPTPSGQLINFPLATSSIFFFSTGGTTSQLLPFASSGTMTIPFVTVPFATPVSLQAAFLAPQHPDGIALSQGCQLNVATLAYLTTPSPGPIMDDGVTAIGVGCVSVYGTAYSVIQVLSNGRVQFGGFDTDPTPTIAEAFADAPSVGAWVDFAPQVSGAITIVSLAPDVLSVTWQGVPYFGNPMLIPDFSIQFEGSTGAIVLTGLDTFPTFPVTPGASNVEFLGLCAGNLGGTDPGPQTFTLGGPFGSLGNFAAIYEFGIAGTLAPGVNTLRFIPTPFGYLHQGL